MTRAILAAALFVFSGFSWAVVVAPASAKYAEGVSPDAAGKSCNWQQSMVGKLFERSKAGIVPFDTAGAGAHAFGLTLEITDLKLKVSAKESEYAAVMRADIRFDGKLVATRNFSSDASFEKGQSACDALDDLGSSLASDAADWIVATRFAECPADCTGIHPDEAIVVGPEVIALNADSISDTIRKDCDWPAAMVTKVVTAFNKSGTPVHARLEKRPIDIEHYAGRRLVLYVDNVHALAGGGLSGPKWMSMRGELRDGTLLVASFESYSDSGRGLTTCRSVDALGDDTTDKIVEWLQSPTLDAKLK